MHLYAHKPSVYGLPVGVSIASSLEKLDHCVATIFARLDSCKDGDHYPGEFEDELLTVERMCKAIAHETITIKALCKKRETMIEASFAELAKGIIELEAEAEKLFDQAQGVKQDASNLYGDADALSFTLDLPFDVGP
jgi:hypothetical protein